ncbi:hypothetical protein D3C73_977030 [compost metagenome]
MGGNGRNQDVKKKIDRIFKLIDQENLVEAENKIEELQLELNGDIPELIEAKSLILMMK